MTWGWHILITPSIDIKSLPMCALPKMQEHHSWWFLWLHLIFGSMQFSFSCGFITFLTDKLLLSGGPEIEDATLPLSGISSSDYSYPGVSKVWFVCESLIPLVLLHHCKDKMAV